MKRICSLFLALVMLLSLTACGGSGEQDSSGTDDAQELGLHVELEATLTKEESFTNDDGVVLLTEKYTLPQLALYTQSGELYEFDGSMLAECCANFNAELVKAAEDLDAAAQESLEAAKAAYDALDEEGKANWMPYAEELTYESSYTTDGLISAVCTAYSSGGGTHPNSGLKAWSFDLLNGEFLTFDTLSNEEDPLSKNLTGLLASKISAQIYDNNLSEGYFDDYLDKVNDLAENASFYFTESGMTVYFDVYVLAPYAAGAQSFDIPYSEFYYALSAETQLLLTIPQEDAVVSDYYAAQTMWSWFYMTMPPLVSSDEPAAKADDGTELYAVDMGYVTTMDDLRGLLCTYVSESIADEWLATGKFVEKDGVLYATMGERGSDITIGKLDYSVTLNGESGVLTQTVSYQDFDENGKPSLTGETATLEYPFTLTGGHAVFTAFPCPL